MTRVLFDDAVAVGCTTHLPMAPPENETAHSETGGDGVAVRQSSEEPRRSRQSASTGESLVLQATATVVVSVGDEDCGTPRCCSWDDDDDDIGEGGHFWQSSAKFVGVVDWLDMVNDGIVEDWSSSLGRDGDVGLSETGRRWVGTCRSCTSSAARSGWRWLSRSWSKAVNTVEPRLTDDPVSHVHRTALVDHHCVTRRWMPQRVNYVHATCDRAANVRQDGAATVARSWTNYNSALKSAARRCG